MDRPQILYRRIDHHVHGRSECLRRLEAGILKGCAELLLSTGQIVGCALGSRSLVGQAAAAAAVALINLY